MKVKNHGCCDLEYAIKLKKLGVKQESEWYWEYSRTTTGNKNHELVNADVAFRYTGAYHYYSAFTVAELWGLLPYNTYFTKGSIPRVDYDKHHEKAVTEANAGAKMLIYLIKEGLIKT